MSMNGKELLDINCQKCWNIGAGLFIVLSEHTIESLEIYNSKVFHVKALFGCLVGEISGQNVVVATNSRSTQQLVNICRLSSHSFLFVCVSRIFSSVENESKGEMEVYAQELSAQVFSY